MNLFENVTNDDVQWARENYGERTINDLRREVGQKEVPGGDLKYYEFLRLAGNVPTQRHLRLVERPGREL